MKQIIIIWEVLNKNKSVKFHTREGGGLDKFGSFSHFFLLALFHANMQRKVYFVVIGGGYNMVVYFFEKSLSFQSPFYALFLKF